MLLQSSSEIRNNLSNTVKSSLYIIMSNIPLYEKDSKMQLIFVFNKIQQNIFTFFQTELYKQQSKSI
jgi:hypothetical protein